MNKETTFSFKLTLTQKITLRMSIFFLILKLKENFRGFLMSLVVSSEDVSDKIVIITLEGELNSDTAKVFRDVKKKAMEAGQVNIALDCRELVILASIGIREFISLYKDTSGSKGKMIFFGMRKQIKDTMTSMGLLSIFKIVDKREDALAALED